MRIVFEESPTPEDLQVLENGIVEHGRSTIGTWGHNPLAFFLRDKDNSIAGGIYGNSGFGWLYISDLWVASKLRGKGYGSQLIKSAEQEGVKRGCRNVFLNTFSFQALEFYQKLGYYVFAQLEDFPQHHIRYFLRKELSETSINDPQNRTK